MRYFYQILVMVSLLATIGSFLIALIVAVHTTSEPQTQVQSARCDWTIYEPTIRKLRREAKPDGIERFLWLGADSRFNYYYDYVADDVVCTVQLKPNGPLVHPSRRHKTNRAKGNIILFCVLMIVFSGVGLMIIKLFR